MKYFKKLCILVLCFITSSFYNQETISNKTVIELVEFEFDAYTIIDKINSSNVKIDPKHALNFSVDELEGNKFKVILALLAPANIVLQNKIRCLTIEKAVLYLTFQYNTIFMNKKSPFKSTDFFFIKLLNQYGLFI